MVAKSKFAECILDIKSISKDENKDQPLLVPASASLYIPGTIKDNKKFMVDIGTGYYIEKEAPEAIIFYQKKIDKLTQESTQIQNIMKEKSQSSMAIETQIRQLASQQQQAIGASAAASGDKKTAGK